MGDKLKKILKTTIMVPSAPGNASTYVTSGRDIPKVESTVGKELLQAVPAAAITAAPVITTAAPAITHGLTVMANPALANTTVGAVVATGLDALGLVGSATGLKQKYNKTLSGDFKWKDVPETILYGTGILPGASVITRPSNWITAINTGKSAIRTIDDTATIGSALIDGRLKFGNPKNYTGIHQSNTDLTEAQFPFNRWDVETHNADPNGFWLTLSDKPNTTGTMASRPFSSRWRATSQKPLIQTGEINSFLGGKNSTRNAIVKFGKRHGADAFEFRGIKDNGLPTTDVVMLTEKTNPERLSEYIRPRIILHGSRPISTRERLGIPRDFQGSINEYFDNLGMVVPDWVNKYEAGLPVSVHVRKSPLEHYQEVNNVARSVNFNPIGASNDELLRAYLHNFRRVGKYNKIHVASPMKAPDGSTGYAISEQYRFNLTPELIRSNFNDIASELNKRKLFPGIDLSDVSTVDKISDITEAIKGHPFVKEYRNLIRMPLDIDDMLWIKRPMLETLPNGSTQITKILPDGTIENTGKYIIDSKLIDDYDRGLTTFDGLAKKIKGEVFIPTGGHSEQMRSFLTLPRGTSITELNTSSASESMKSILSGLTYGKGRGQTTITKVDPRLAVDEAIIGNRLHFGGIRENPDGSYSVIGGKKPFNINISKKDVSDIKSGYATEDQIRRFDQLLEALKSTTIDKMGKGIDLLNSQDRSLQLAAPQMTNAIREPITRDLLAKYLLQNKNNSNYYSNTLDLFKFFVKRDPIIVDLHKKGGFIKMQEGKEIPNKQDFPKPLIPKKSSTQQDTPPQSLQPAPTFEERLKQVLARLKSTQRPKPIGVYSFAYKQPTKIVEDGGNMS